MKTKYILIASNGKGVGKSTFSLSLAKELKNNKNVNIVQANFADGVRDDVFHLIATHSDITVQWLRDNYNNIKDLSIEYNEKTKGVFVLRTMLNKYSLFLSEFFPANVWAEKYYSSVQKQLENNKTNIIISDDLRRMEEMTYILNREDVLSIYLYKEDVVAPEETSFEGLLNPKDFNLQFTFTEDWSNTKEILDSVLSHVQ